MGGETDDVGGWTVRCHRFVRVKLFPIPLIYSFLTRRIITFVIEMGYLRNVYYSTTPFINRRKSPQLWCNRELLTSSLIWTGNPSSVSLFYLIFFPTNVESDYTISVSGERSGVGGDKTSQTLGFPVMTDRIVPQSHPFDPTSFLHPSVMKRYNCLWVLISQL